MDMNTVRTVPMPPSWDSSLGPVAHPEVRGVTSAAAARASHAEFRALQAAYRPTGGLARGDDLVRLLEDWQQGDHVSLARLIVARAVFGFKWHGQFWIPMFQFELHDLSIKMAHRQVLVELAPVFDSWSLAVWFAQPNSWLCGQSPVNVLGNNLPAVLDAARADRFIANG